MQFIRGLINFPPSLFNKVAITIGSFDGIHLGHLSLLDKLIENSQDKKLKSVLLSFYTSPKKFFNKKHIVVNNFRQNYNILKKTKLDYYLLIKFDSYMANINSEEFVQKILINEIGIKYCLIGDDFRFGKNRNGDYNLLHRIGNQNNFIVEKIPPILYDGKKISSSNIRTKLQKSKFSDIEKILGRKFSVISKVIRGDGLGSKIGVPTANLAIKNNKSIVKGVFCTYIIIDNNKYQSITNVGIKPTVSNKNKLLIEVHIFNFNKFIYNKKVEVIFEYKIREEVKFSSIEKLKEQIKKDIITAKKMHKLK